MSALTLALLLAGAGIFLWGFARFLEVFWPRH